MSLDAGCLQYHLHADLDDINSFIFIETWENEELLAQHSSKEHFSSFVKKIEGKLESFEISKLEKLI
jgi:quinol monooxygenase YgiN